MLVILVGGHQVRKQCELIPSSYQGPGTTKEMTAHQEETWLQGDEPFKPTANVKEGSGLYKTVQTNTANPKQLEENSKMVILCIYNYLSILHNFIFRKAVQHQVAAVGFDDCT